MRGTETTAVQCSHSRRGPKLLLYSHDTVGLGNIRRTLLLAHALAHEVPDASVLIVTGSPMVHAMQLPVGVDYVKLPELHRPSRDTYEARTLVSRTREVKRARREILVATARSFDPDLVLVDKSAAGVGGELLPALEGLRRRGRAKLVLGMRDVLDAPERTRAALQRSGAFDAMERFYQEVWIYGSACVFDATKEYAFPGSVAAKTRYCGYLGTPPGGTGRPLGAPGVLVTVGGGHDGAQVIQAYLEGLREFTMPGALRSVVVLGPQMPASDRSVLLRRHRGMPGVRFADFQASMSPLYAGADVVVGMAGYGTVCELLSRQRRAVLVPRAEPVSEQTIRARRLSQLGLFPILEWHELSPERLITAVFRALDGPPPRIDGHALHGVREVRRRARALLAGRAA